MAEEPNDEQGQEPEAKTVDLTVEFPKRKIALSFGEQAVEIEGSDDLDVLAALAERLWKLTSPPRPVRFGFAAGSTLVTELAGGDGPGDPDDADTATHLRSAA